MITMQQVNTLPGRHVIDRQGDRIGRIGQVWADAVGQPAWVSVKTGLFGMRESVVPLRGAEMRGEDMMVPFDTDHVKHAPHVDTSHAEPLSAGEVENLYRHYGMEPAEAARAYESGAAQTRKAYPGPARTAQPGRRAEEPMTRSEERLRVGTERDEVGVARLRKYVVTEQQQVNVPVNHEEVRVERHPVRGTGAGRGLGHPDIHEEQREIPLHADRPVVDTETVPVEEVRLDRETVTDQRRVGGPVRKEHIEADLPEEGRRGIS